MVTGCFSGQIIQTSIIIQKLKSEHLSLNSAFRGQVLSITHVLHLGSLAKSEDRICPGVALKLAPHITQLDSKKEASSRSLVNVLYHVFINAA